MDLWGGYKGYDLNPNLFYGPNNLGPDIVEAYDWIVANKDIYGGIDIISLSSTYDQDVREIFSDAQSNTLKNYGIYMLTSAGNGGTNFNNGDNKYPNIYASWYTVGAVNPDGTFWTQSSYGSTTADAADAIYYVMPGVGVPVYDRIDGWTYADGNSYSTPYLAATVAVLIEEYRQNIGDGINNPSISKINELLKDYSSGSFTQKLGWGYVNIYNLYAFLNTEPPEPPVEDDDPPPGGGCNPFVPCLDP
ncbi:MAG: S8/S53 family peptidase [Candidatus Heimdallarchaeota archaeon]|nr:S8/S53 family peptidase [Candidatus Heimdallarchaeota archaeon]